MTPGDMVETDVGLVSITATKRTDMRDVTDGTELCGIDSNGEVWFGKYGVDCQLAREAAA